jgi:hypothetical protein
MTQLLFTRTVDIVVAVALVVTLLHAVVSMGPSLWLDGARRVS